MHRTYPFVTAIVVDECRNKARLLRFDLFENVLHNLADDMNRFVNVRFTRLHFLVVIVRNLEYSKRILTEHRQRVSSSLSPPSAAAYRSATFEQYTQQLQSKNKTGAQRTAVVVVVRARRFWSCQSVS